MALTDGIVGCWSPVGQNGGGPTIRDLSKLQNHLRWTGYTTASDSVSSTRGASFRAVKASAVAGQKVEANISTAGLNGYNGPWSMAAWENIATYTQLAVSFGFGVQLPVAAGAVGRYSLQYAGNFYLWGGANDWDTAIPYITGRWVHVAWAWDGNRTSLYIDGVQKAATTTYIPSTPGQYATLFSNHSSGGVTNGQVAEFCIWKRPLPASEWLELYRRGVGWLGRELRGVNRRRVYGFVPATGARRRRILCGGNC